MNDKKVYLEKEIEKCFNEISGFSLNYPNRVNTIYSYPELGEHVLEIIVLGKDDDDYGIVIDFHFKSKNENIIELTMEVLNGLGHFLYDDDICFLNNENLDVNLEEEIIKKIRKTCELAWRFFFDKYLKVNGSV